MSEHMLCDEDAINDVNPFVSRDFSLPGGVGQTGDFADFSTTRKKPAFQKGRRVSTVITLYVRRALKDVL